MNTHARTHIYYWSVVVLQDPEGIYISEIRFVATSAYTFIQNRRVANSNISEIQIGDSVPRGNLRVRLASVRRVRVHSPLMVSTFYYDRFFILSRTINITCYPNLVKKR